MVDELDRCRPTYAIALLERIKHLFNINGIFFILGMDIMQLNHSVKAIYGQNMESEGYIKRFIDFEFSLPIPNKTNFVKYIFNRFGIDKIINNEYDKGKLIQIFIVLSEMFSFSLRTIEHILTEYNLILRSMSTETIYYSFSVAGYLISLKYYSKNPI